MLTAYYKDKYVKEENSDGKDALVMMMIMMKVSLTVNTIMQYLRDHVNDLLETILTHRVQNEDGWNVHAYSLAIMFYLGYYPKEDSIEIGFNSFVS